MDNGSAHRGHTCIKRLRQRWPAIVPVHTPVHASWLNQIEIYFSIAQRKVLTPMTCAPSGLQARLLNFQHYETVARPFQWKFRRADLGKLLTKLCTHKTLARAA